RTSSRCCSRTRASKARRPCSSPSTSTTSRGWRSTSTALPTPWSGCASTRSSTTCCCASARSSRSTGRRSRCRPARCTCRALPHGRARPARRTTPACPTRGPPAARRRERRAKWPMAASSPIGRSEVIAIDLDDKLWPSRPTLVAAEALLARWLEDRAPAAAANLDPERRARLRRRLLERHPDRAHDVSFLRRESLRLALDEAGEDPGLADPAFEVFLAARQQVEPYEDVDEVLCRWAARYRLVALSNGNADIARIPCGRHFSAAISAHEIGFA